ncbi:monofunctional biosynthetic peptidoglycan transglycosylase [Psychromonas sp. 14N.309.X.WAT.B.A12]|uniref:monofunctional biosynthetic peptidoglycan transglycosylase n=1 Tax=unclassified Psychromonas TaxID=2614957 RepID=UPI0025B18568|nr:monofunctional biosynthetic peptidoglycan transglycosylase [Psychromonas sp. 14N.309.X.WAT.B.A12]MDN2663715.1 monofunctional biosynthetic peptidoglycan transglycosylase [Psychromonas sp. 14N.309.X.WAT.B.A12]
MAKKKKSSLLGKIWYVLWRLLLLMILTLLLFRFVPLPTSAFMLQSPYPVTQKWISIDKLSPAMSLAVVASEDQRFPTHFGVDFTAIVDALEQYDDGDGLRGASTITQQTAKNIFLWSGRSFIRKGLEAGLALSLEAAWGKKRILEVYLNIAEFGKGIYGVEAASQHYFGKSATQLTAHQTAQLAVLLPSPRTRDPRNLTAKLSQRVIWVERQMRQLGAGYLKPILEN